MIGRASLLLALLAPRAAAQSLPIKATAWKLPTAFGALKAFDHSYFDAPSGRLYVSAKGVDKVLVLLGKGSLFANISVHAPQGLGVAGGKLFVGSDEIGVLNVFDAATYAPLAQLNFSLAPDVGEADDIVVAPNGDILCAVGDDADGSTDPARLAVVDSKTLAVKGVTSSDGAHIEGFALAAGSSSDVMASTPDKKVVLRIDAASQKIVARYALPGDATPLAWDSANEVRAVRRRRRSPSAQVCAPFACARCPSLTPAASCPSRTQVVMVATRKPAAFVVLDVSAAGAGKVVYSHEVADDADDLHFDAESGMVYVSGGGNKTSAGAIACFHQDSASAYSYIGSVSPAGKNSEYSAAKKTLWTTVPATKDADAFIQTYLTH
jgi:hypothetical protein